MVAVKKLRVEIGMTSLELFQEIKCNLEHNSLFISRVYGVTKDPSTKEYAIVMQFQKNGDIRQLMQKNHQQLNWIKSLGICNQLKPLRPPIPSYTPKQYKEVMKKCWKHNPDDRPTAKELSQLFFDWYKILKGEYPKYNPNLLKSDIEEEFNTSKEKEWKVRLAKLAEVLSPSKEISQQYTSRRLDYSKMLSQRLQELYKSEKIYEVDTCEEDNYDDSKLIDLVIP
ncbi:6432_t:CDS:2 [Dentiscutata heterogama]|uniref:6432_t:CDS:1 n=1 Tax=Dentiscutata heterogama TaxID=1316150 RepID=A0ACA9MI10_9GLOM|nr:6432_t:CDS:2 [Dentiscutata heterogama]